MSLKRQDVLPVADIPLSPHVQIILVVTVVMKVAECVCVSVTVSAGTILVVSVSINAGPTTTSLLLLEDNVATLSRVAVRVRDIVLVIVSVESLDNDSLYPVNDDRANPLRDDP